MKKTIRGLEEKTQEQEEELDDQAGKIQMLEQVRTEHANEILHYVGITYLRYKCLFIPRGFRHLASRMILAQALKVLTNLPSSVDLWGFKIESL